MLRADSGIIQSWRDRMRAAHLSELILQAPQFLYLYTAGTPAGDVHVLDGYERAQRLSYFLWDTLPDRELLDAAESGALDTPEGMRAQAERMLMDERAKPVLRAFLADWLELGETCRQQHGDCLEDIKRVQLPEMPFTLAYDVVGSTNTQRVTRPATPQEARAIRDRLDWDTAMAGLRGRQSAAR